MILRYPQLSCFPALFQELAGLESGEFDAMVEQLATEVLSERQHRLARPDRRRAIGGGDKTMLDPRDQILMTTVWLHIHPTNEALGQIFGVSDSTASRVLSRLEKVLVSNNADGMRTSDPGRKHRRQLEDLRRDIHGLAEALDAPDVRIG